MKIMKKSKKECYQFASGTEECEYNLMMVHPPGVVPTFSDMYAKQRLSEYGESKLETILIIL